MRLPILSGRKSALFAALALVVLSGCSKDAPLNFLHPEGPVARSADKLWDLTFAIAVGVFLLVEGGLVFILFKYREKSKTDAPKQVHGNTRLEILWTAIPVLLLIGVAIPTVAGIIEASAEPKGEVMKVDVIGHQWWWEYRYDNGVVTANELHIPIGVPVRLNLTSVDVIHSFWVPKLAGKQDVIPGRVNKMTIEAEHPEEYLGQCAEYCGLSHANMRLKAIAQTRADFDEWTKAQLSDRVAPTDALAQQGEELFINGQFAQGQQCQSCHAIKGTPAQGQVGPNLTHFATRTTFAAGMFDRNEKNVAAWLHDPAKVKPGSKMPNLGLDEDEILALVTYLQGLN